VDSNFQYAGAVNLAVAPFMPPNARDGRCALSVFGQHNALHQSGVDPTAEAAIRAGDAQREFAVLTDPRESRLSADVDAHGWGSPGCTRQPLPRVTRTHALFAGQSQSILG
jgi:hypothetical protein